jgi:hypothetical protein
MLLMALAAAAGAAVSCKQAVAPYIDVTVPGEPFSQRTLLYYFSIVVSSCYCPCWRGFSYVGYCVVLILLVQQSVFRHSCLRCCGYVAAAAPAVARCQLLVPACL